jgi:hypothetical protein
VERARRDPRPGRGGGGARHRETRRGARGARRCGARGWSDDEAREYRKVPTTKPTRPEPRRWISFGDRREARGDARDDASESPRARDGEACSPSALPGAARSLPLAALRSSTAGGRGRGGWRVSAIGYRPRRHAFVQLDPRARGGDGDVGRG